MYESTDSSRVIASCTYVYPSHRQHARRCRHSSDESDVDSIAAAAATMQYVKSSVKSEDSCVIYKYAATEMDR